MLLPLPEADFADDPAAWAEARAAIARARAGDGGGSLRVLTGARVRPDCYRELARAIVRECDVLVAVWDGEVAAGIGGTGELVAAARARTVPVLVVDPRTGARDAGEMPVSWPVDA